MSFPSYLNILYIAPLPIEPLCLCVDALILTTRFSGTRLAPCEHRRPIGAWVKKPLDIDVANIYLLIAHDTHNLYMPLCPVMDVEAPLAPENGTSGIDLSAQLAQSFRTSSIVPTLPLLCNRHSFDLMQLCLYPATHNNSFYLVLRIVHCTPPSNTARVWIPKPRTTNISPLPCSRGHTPASGDCIYLGIVVYLMYTQSYASSFCLRCVIAFSLALEPSFLAPTI